MVEGLGTTIDVILANGELHEGDTIIVCGLNEPIVTKIKALMLPEAMKRYARHATVKAARGLKIAAPHLHMAIAGSPVLVLGPGEDLEQLKLQVQQKMTSLHSRLDKTGVRLHASSLGALEALLTLLKENRVLVGSLAIGPVEKKDIRKASAMLTHPIILAYDVKVGSHQIGAPVASNLGEEVRIFTSDVIYDLCDQITAYLQTQETALLKQKRQEAVFPCILQILPGSIFTRKNPIILGCRVLQGCVYVGTPICVPDKKVFIGHVSSLHVKNQAVEQAQDVEVAIKLSGCPTIMYNRHFDHTNLLVSQLTRSSIDVLKQYFKEEVGMDGWKLVVKLKKLLHIP